MRTILMVASAILAAGHVRAQSSGGPATPQKALDETGRILKAARSSAVTESTLQAAGRAADNGRLDRLAAEARQKLATNPADEGRELAAAADRRLEPALKGASPEGRAIIAQSAAAPAMRAPDPDAAAAPAGRTPARSTDGAKGKPGEVPPPNDIDIHSEGAVYFDSAQALAIFTDDVVVEHPRFHMTSDKLEVYFVKESDKKAGDAKVPVAKAVDESAVKGAQLADPGASAKPGSDPLASDQGDSQLKEAIATGKMVVIRKLDEKGEIQVGICRHATYIGESGDIILRQKPQVQRGTNVIIAREPSTYMVLKQNGELKVHGPADTKIVQKPASDGKLKPAGLAPAGAVPGGPPNLSQKPASDAKTKPSGLAPAGAVSGGPSNLTPKKATRP